jgi:phosphoribosylanthranilate isomerase
VAPVRARALLEGTAALKVAVVVDVHADAAAAVARSVGADVIQLHGEEAPEELEDLRLRGPWKLWKSVRAKSLEDVETVVERYGRVADGILIEGWKDGVVGGGGAAVTLDGARVREIVPASVQFVLAGGLRVDTVADAIRRFEPDIVDVSSGVERAPREKDPELVTRFIHAAAVAGSARGVTREAR